MAEWANSQPDWAPIEVVGDFMRGDAVKILKSFHGGYDYDKALAEQT